MDRADRGVYEKATEQLSKLHDHGKIADLQAKQRTNVAEFVSGVRARARAQRKSARRKSARRALEPYRARRALGGVAARSATLLACDGMDLVAVNGTAVASIDGVTPEYSVK